MLKCGNSDENFRWNKQNSNVGNMDSGMRLYP